ncbi:MAG: UDP-3-O-(3-hydroxymyristoyl)glucosamine N-acyltransferase [Deltaproteobacteria bacterium]|nr:UDP-3-O-(3-hydroxymyristoyl)glucosamine N-acyltransferase [Deltaproteobacteria bacterium]
MSHTLGELAVLVGGELKGPAELVISGIAAVDQATPRDITFITGRRYARLVETSQAAAFIVGPEYADLPRPLIVVPHPYLAYAQVAALFAPPLKRHSGVSRQAFLGQGVELGEDVSIAPLVFVGDGTRVGARSTIMAGSVIGQEVVIGEETLIYPNVTILDRCRVGSRVIIHSGTVIGSDGFGFVPLPSGFHKIPQLGVVVIEDEVEIGANCTVDRAALGETRIGKGVKIDNLVQVAHNVTIGDHSIIVAQAGIAGSAKLGRRVALGGQAGLVGHIELGDGVQVGAKTGVTHSLPPGQVVLGSPARPHRQFLAINAHLSKLPDMYQRLKHLEKQVAQLTARLEDESES